jgi:hypothetical protein
MLVKRLKSPKSEKVGKDIDGKGEVSQKGEVGGLTKNDCRIGLSKGMTVNLGNYESAKISVWMERVVENDPHIIDDNMENISNYLDDVLQAEVDELKN